VGNEEEEAVKNVNLPRFSLEKPPPPHRVRVAAAQAFSSSCSSSARVRYDSAVAAAKGGRGLYGKPLTLPFFSFPAAADA